jgi:hypothetical protein
MRRAARHSKTLHFQAQEDNLDIDAAKHRKLNIGSSVRHSSSAVLNPSLSPIALCPGFCDGIVIVWAQFAS